MLVVYEATFEFTAGRSLLSNMVVTFTVLMILTVVCGASPSAGLHAPSGVTQHEAGIELTDSFTKTREKRGISIIAQGIRALALRKLLRGLQPIGKFDPKYKNLVKTGDYDDALKDFKSLKPMNVVERKAESGATVLTGSIGNKKIKIRSPGYKFASNAVLDIIDYSSPNKELGIPYIVSVVYKKRN